ncbi:MAG: hypothetical protein V4689_02190 [Verrucomicrobiota bacterium]
MNWFHLAACAVVSFPCLVRAWEPDNVPTGSARMDTGGFSVDNSDRNDVVAFWHAVYQASEGYQDRIKWNGNYTGDSGEVSAAFVDDVERRLNYFRAMCGLHSRAKVNSGSTVIVDPVDPFKPAPSTKKYVAAQNAALMLVRNYNPSTGVAPALTHHPEPGLAGWSTASWNACSKSNFAFGLYGPGALTEYMIEKISNGSAISSWNSLVGHRRWCLYPRATDFATGDQPGNTASRPPSNIFYVIQNPNEIDEDAPTGFVAYPAPGFFPAAINTPFWSVSRENADFAFATVKMTDSKGNPVLVSNISRSADYGDPAIIWQVGDTVGATSVYTDTTYNVKVSGIGGEGVPATFSYSVTLINPDRILSSQKLAGPATVKSNSSGIFTLTPPPRAEALQVVAYKKQSSSWTENAENSKNARVIDGTGGNYPLMARTAAYSGFGTLSGNYSFRLTFPTSYDAILRGVPDQSFELDREIIAKSNAKLNFVYRRGYMTRGTTLVIERSSNGGVTWKPVGSPIKGVSDTTVDTSISSASISIPKSAAPVRIRFRYFTTGGSIYTHEALPTYPTGIFIDDITTKSCDWLEPKKVNFLSATATDFQFNASKAGEKLAGGDGWMLALRTKLGGRWFPNGPVKPVSIVAP